MSVKQKSCPALLVLSLWMTFAACIEGSCTEQSWFGPNCTFMCRCGKNDCDKVSGECGPNIECSHSWFGPSCQYFDVLHGLWKQGSPPFLTDGNTSTCNPDREAMELNIDLVWAIRFFWIRIQTDIDMSSYDLDLSLTKGKCSHKKIYRISETVLHLHCDSTERTQLHILRGKAVGRICDIKFSGGRNLALRQQASQSSDYTGLDLKDVQASNAVDGSMNSCTQTDRVPGSPWFTLQFSRYVHVYRLEFFTSTKYLARWDKISVFIFDNSTKIYGCYYASWRPERQLSVYLPIKGDRGNKVYVGINQAGDVNLNFFSLCEVEVFGDYICPVEKWGLSCENSCKCGPQESCSQVTGACSSPCFSQGQVYNVSTHNCTYPCRPNCVSALCQGEGDCPLCVEEQCRVCRSGFSGGFCDQECPKGMFGENCTSQCSRNCSDSLCNSVSGDCLACPENKVLPRCLENTHPELAKKLRRRPQRRRRPHRPPRPARRQRKKPTQTH